MLWEWTGVKLFWLNGADLILNDAGFRVSYLPNKAYLSSKSKWLSDWKKKYSVDWLQQK